MSDRQRGSRPETDAYKAWSCPECGEYHAPCANEQIARLTEQLAALREAGDALWTELQDAAFGYAGVHWKVQRDAPPVLAAWRACVAEVTRGAS